MIIYLNKYLHTQHINVDLAFEEFQFIAGN